MTFLAPFILWALPLIFLPVLIHLFNRLRHRSMPWAAMMFLRSATRKSTRYARLKQFLILLFRVLAVLGLVMALSRPLAGGWMGWMLGGAPDVIMVLLDRSASMEAKTSPAAEATKLGEAVTLMARSSEGFRQASRLVLIDNATLTPLEVPPGALAALPAVRGSDTRADLPAMMQRALDWFIEQRPGSGELWIASDLQASNWEPGSERWNALASGFQALPQKVRVRLLAMNQEPTENLSVTIVSAEPRQRNGQWELELVFDVMRQHGSTAEVPIELVVNGVPSHLDLRLDGASLRSRQRHPLGAELTSGWGYLALPADGNMRDNRSYFVFGPTPPLAVAIVSEDPWSRAVLGLAAAPDPGNTNVISRPLEPGQVEGLDWNQFALVIWQGSLGKAAAPLENYIRGGGSLLCFPPAGQDSILGMGWGEAESSEEPFRVTTWDRQEGALADVEDGSALPVEGLSVRRRQPVVGEASVLASFQDGMPFLVRRSVGEGKVLLCSTAVDPSWSDLAEGTVLVPMIQRLILEGAQRFQSQYQRECGFWLEDTAAWTAVDATEAKDPRLTAGVYRAQGRLMALNRPAVEDDSAVVEAERAKALFGNLTTRLFEEQGGMGRLQSELWRVFLLAMAAFLLVEAILILPERTVRLPGVPVTPSSAGGDETERREVAMASQHE